MLRVVVNGALGRMGAAAAAAIASASDMHLAGAVERGGHNGLGASLHGVAVSPSLAPILAAADVVVDFTNPEAALACIETCAGAGVPVITGTTGLTPEHLERAAALSDRTAVLVSPNMAVGVNLLFRLAGDTARALADFDVEIVEMHHNRKQDAPSGTAARLADAVATARGAGERIYGRRGMTGERARGEIGLHALRAGDVTGEHTVIFAGEGERIELTHRAHSRQVFAAGTLRAIRFIAGKPAGLYTMNDVLGL